MKRPPAVDAESWVAEYPRLDLTPHAKAYVYRTNWGGTTYYLRPITVQRVGAQRRTVVGYEAGWGTGKGKNLQITWSGAPKVNRLAAVISARTIMFDQLNAQAS